MNDNKTLLVLRVWTSSCTANCANKLTAAANSSQHVAVALLIWSSPVLWPILTYCTFKFAVGHQSRGCNILTLQIVQWTLRNRNLYSLHVEEEKSGTVRGKTQWIKKKKITLFWGINEAQCPWFVSRLGAFAAWQSPSSRSHLIYCLLATISFQNKGITCPQNILNTSYLL